MLPPTLRRRRAYATPTHTPMAPLHPLDSATATFDGATPVNASSPICLCNDEHSSSEEVRLSPDVQLEFSTTASVLGGGEDEHELEHESMSMTLTAHECEHGNGDNSTSTESGVEIHNYQDISDENTTPMNGGGSNPENTTLMNGGGSSPTKTMIDFTAAQLMLDKASIRVAELGNQLLHATSDLFTADLEGESTVMEGSAPQSFKTELLTAVETKLGDMRVRRVN